MEINDGWFGDARMAKFTRLYFKKALLIPAKRAGTANECRARYHPSAAKIRSANPRETRSPSSNGRGRFFRLIGGMYG